MNLSQQEIISHLRDIYGYRARKGRDLRLIDYYIEHTENLIKNFCHLDQIPNGAIPPAIDYICGNFFLRKINSGDFIDEDGNPILDLTVPEASVSIGDVTVSYEDGYAGMYGDNGFYEMAKELADPDHLKEEIVHFRRLKWQP